ncbi:hypothetical protein RI054_32g125620 [Pseudoscourfieldia marina]
MGDAPNELEVLEARREVLQEIALAQERRAGAGEQKGKKAAEEGGEPTLDYVGHASSHNAWIFRSIVSVSAYLELGVLSPQQETDDRVEDLATYVEENRDVERGDDGKPLDPDGDALVRFNELNKKIARIDSVLERTRNTLTAVLELAAELEDFFVANKGPRTVITKETADATDERSRGQSLGRSGREQPEEWRRIGAGPQLLHWIAKGVAITFTNGPPPSYDLGASLTSMTEEENSFMEAETSRLLKLGAWEEIDGGAAHCVNRVHLVPKVGSKKFRLVRRVAPRVQRQYKVQQGAIAPWAGAIRKRMERIAPGDPDGLTDWIARPCHRIVPPLTAGYELHGRMLPQVARRTWHGPEEVTEAIPLVINTVHKDLGYRQRPAIGSLVKSMKRAYGRKVVRIRPAPRILVMPARIILDMWRRVEELTALPDLEYITKLPEIRALLACIVCYITGSRPSSIALLPLTGVAFALDSELGIQRSYVKTLRMLAISTFPAANGHLAGDHDVANAGKNAHALRSDAPSGVLACRSRTPPNGHYAPKSFRSGFASAVTAMNVSPDRRNYIAGWAANSHAVGTHYVDNSVVVDDAARFLFGHLIGLPPPPVEVPVAPVAPWSSPLANLASRLVTLVSPLRGDT